MGEEQAHLADVRVVELYGLNVIDFGAQGVKQCVLQHRLVRSFGADLKMSDGRRVFGKLHLSQSRPVLHHPADRLRRW